MLLKSGGPLWYLDETEIMIPQVEHKSAPTSDARCKPQE